MLVLCEECRNHYDDESQSEECKGIGVTAGVREGVASSHENLRNSTAITSHVENTRASWPARTTTASAR